MAPIRYNGSVSHWNPVDDFGEITMEGHAPLHAQGADLRRAGAAEVGAPVTFTIGVLHGGTTGAINIERTGA